MRMFTRGGRMPSDGHIFSLQTSQGGVPKLPVREARVTTHGLQGDRQRDTVHNGGPERALCLFSLEARLHLQVEVNPIYPGSTGENVTVAGLDWAAIVVGDYLTLGEDVLVHVTQYATP